MDWLYTALIVIAVLALIWILGKTKHTQPILIALLCFAWAGAGLYSGITYYQYSVSQSKVNGTPVIHAPYEDYDFHEYSLSDIAWYADEEGNYCYSTSYKAVVDFDGDSNKYCVLLNDKPTTETTSVGGRLSAKHKLVFRDIDKNILTIINMNIDFEFYSSEVHLTIGTDAGDDQIKILREYISVNGFNLRIIDAVYIPTL